MKTLEVTKKTVKRLNTSKEINLNSDIAKTAKVEKQIKKQIAQTEQREKMNKTPKSQNSKLQTTVTTTFADMLKNAEKNKTVNRLVKKSKQVLTSYKGLRSSLIDMFNTDMYQFSVAEIKYCNLLKESRYKNNTLLHQTLLSVCPFVYSLQEVTNIEVTEGKKITTVKTEVVQKYSVKNLFVSCQLYFDANNELTPLTIAGLKRENVKRAIEVAKNAVISAQNKVHNLNLDYEQVSNERKAEKLKLLEAAKETLLKKVSLYETVKNY